MPLTKFKLSFFGNSAFFMLSLPQNKKKMEKKILREIRRWSSLLSSPVLFVADVAAFVIGIQIDCVLLLFLASVCLAFVVSDLSVCRITEIRSYFKFRNTEGFAFAKKLFLETLNEAKLSEYDNKKLNISLYEDYTRIFSASFIKRKTMFFCINRFEFNGTSICIPYFFESELVERAEEKLKELRNELRKKYGRHANKEVIEFSEKMQQTEAKLEIKNSGKY